MKYTMDDVAYQLAREGTNGSYSPRPGVTVHYGWVDGEAKASLEIADELWKEILEYCKLHRDNGNVLGQLKGGINGMSFLHWPFLDVVFQSRGLDYTQIMEDKDEDGLKKIYEIIETEFPLFKLTNRTLWRPKRAKAV